MSERIALTESEEADPPLIVEEFRKQRWIRPVSLFENYLEYQNSGERDVIVARSGGRFVGSFTVRWESGYPPFRREGVAEIFDFNVLNAHRRRGIGSLLMN